MKFSKKNKEEIISWLMAGTILVSTFISARNFNKNKNSNNDGNKETTTQIEPTTNPVDNDILINSNYKKGEDFIAEINTLDAIYNYADSDIVIPTVLTNNQSCNESYKYDSTNANEVYNATTYLINIIKENSQNYINEHKEFELAFPNSINDSHGVDKIAAQATLKDAIYDILKDGTNKDICLIKNIKYVISYDDTVSKETYVSYNETDNLLIVYPNNVRGNAKNGTYDYWDNLKYNIRYELNKIRQKPCNCQKNIAIFPYKTIKNAAIQTELYNSNEIEILINNTETNIEKLILLLGLFNEEATINNYYNAIFNNDINSFYKFCGVLDNEEEIYKLNKILYTIDNNIDNKNKYNYRVELFGMIINNMIQYTENNKDLNLRDNLILFNIIKNTIITDIENNNEDILENIAIINNIYLEYLSKHYDVSINSIKNKEINNDTINYILATIDVCNKNDNIKVADKYILYSYKLVKKFPLLKQILCNSSLYQLDEQNTIDNGICIMNNNILIKKK